MTTFPFDLRKLIISPEPGSPMPGPVSSAIVFRHRTPLQAIPTQPVGDPVPNPGTPQPTPQRDPSEPVQAPHPREPELPAIDPHEPGLPDTRIGSLYDEQLYEELCVGDPPPSSSVPCWLS
jgi:hypothetical protein